MPFSASCCCSRHDEWKHGEVDTNKLRVCTPEEYSMFVPDQRWKTRKRKICIYCRSRLEMEAKCSRLEDVCSRVEENSVMPVPEEIDDAQEFVPLVPASASTSTHEKHDQGTQRPVVPLVAYKDQTERGKREMRAELISIIKHMALPSVLFEESNIMEFISDVVNSKKWATTFGVNLTNAGESCNPILQSLVKDYKDCMSKEKAIEVQQKAAAQKAKILIGSTLKDSRVTLSGDKTPEEFKNRVAAANSVGRMTYFADERRRLLSIVATNYPYRFLQEQFGCSPNTVTAARVHSILFGRGGTPPPKFKFCRQCVSPSVLEELSDFFMRDDVSRPSSCRSIVVDGEETPVRYWKDSINNLVNQYLLEFPSGVKRTYIYSHLPPSFRSDTMLAGLCNICDEYGHSNYDKLLSLMSEIEQKVGVSLKEEKTKVLKHERFFKNQFSKVAEKHSPCLELCITHVFGTCRESHPSCCSDVVALAKVEKVAQDTINRLADTATKQKLEEELKEAMNSHALYASHLLRTKHQADYHKFILNSLQPGDAVVIIDYKMKLELGVRLRECQRDWYGKRGISLHGLLVIAQVDATRKVSEVLDLWSEDTKQDSWFSQSAMDVGFRWLEKTFPGFRVYLFSDNGPHYHNSGFLLYLAEVNAAFNLHLIEYNNFEAGEGKSKLDTHFAHISHKIVRWVRVGNNLESGSQLGELIGTMKNVKCRKLLIDRSKAPDKVGTLKDISLYGNFQFPTSGPNSGGLIARSLAGMGKEMKKTKVQIQGLANRTCPIAGATGANTSEEICCEAASATPHTTTSEEPYSVRFVQHAAAEQVLPVTMVPVEEEGIVTYAVNPGYALKVGGAKRVLFTLEQKEVMIEFYNRQAQYGIRADADDCIAEMKARGLNPLRKTQITSWWSSYHQKRRRGTERVAADLQQTPATTAPTAGSTASSTITATVSSAVSSMPATTSVIASTVPSATVMVSSTSSTHPAVTEGVSSTVNTFPVSTATVSSTVSTSPTASTMSSVVAASIPAVNVVPVVFTVPNCMVGNDVVPGVTEWYFPLNIAQSTIDNRNGSSACVFIAMNFGLLYKRCGLDTTLIGQSMNTQWQAVLEKAIRDGNQVHDELFDQEGVIVTVEEGIELAGDQCQVSQIYQEYNVFGTNPLSQLETVISSLLLQKFSFHVLVVNSMAMLIVVDSQGTRIFIDSHVHSSKGAVISRFTPDRDTQARRFSLWLNAMLTQSSGLGVSICSISSISYS